MKISARVESQKGRHTIAVATEGRARSLLLPAKAEAPGSEVNGGELLFLALATCYGNGLYREARKCGMEVRRIEVEVERIRPGGRRRAQPDLSRYRGVGCARGGVARADASHRHGRRDPGHLRRATAVALVERRAIPA